MNIDTIKSMLNKADPNSNSSMHERRTALTMAEKEMDKYGLSFASLGFSQKDAERIANQFSLSQPGSNKSEERTSISLFGKRPKANGHSIERKQAARSTGYSFPRKQEQVRREQPHESYTDQCEKKEWADADRRYQNWAAWRVAEDAKEAQLQSLQTKSCLPILLIGILLMAAFIILSFNI